MVAGTYQLTTVFEVVLIADIIEHLQKCSELSELGLVKLVICRCPLILNVEVSGVVVNVVPVAERFRVSGLVY